MEIKEKVRKFLGRFFNGEGIQDDDDIFEKKYVNSLFGMQLVLFIEKEWGIQIDNDDLDLEKFKSINAITELIESKLN